HHGILSPSSYPCYGDPRVLPSFPTRRSSDLSLSSNRVIAERSMPMASAISAGVAAAPLSNTLRVIHWGQVMLCAAKAALAVSFILAASRLIQKVRLLKSSASLSALCFIGA